MTQVSKKQKRTPTLQLEEQFDVQLASAGLMNGENKSKAWSICCMNAVLQILCRVSSDWVIDLIASSNLTRRFSSSPPYIFAKLLNSMMIERDPQNPQELHRAMMFIILTPLLL